jgi:hypothetical protein
LEGGLAIGSLSGKALPVVEQSICFISYNGADVQPP